MTVTYFFFRVFFTSVRVALELLVVNLENPLQWRRQTRLFFVLTEKDISLFGVELLLRQLWIQSINKFLGNRDQNALDIRLFSAIFHRLTIVLIMIKLELQMKAT